jgi:hypothetical protein
MSDMYLYSLILVFHPNQFYFLCSTLFTHYSLNILYIGSIVRWNGRELVLEAHKHFDLRGAIVLKRYYILSLSDASFSVTFSHAQKVLFELFLLTPFQRKSHFFLSQLKQEENPNLYNVLLKINSK